MKRGRKMSFNPTGNILCQRCENFVDGHDCSKCGWEQPSYQEDPLDKANARIEALETVLKELYIASGTVANCAYNVGQSHEDWENIKQWIDKLDNARSVAIKVF